MLTQINPGSWLGIFGGGQLGRMFTHAAQACGYHVAVLEAEAGCPAAQAADRHFCPADIDGSGDILEMVAGFAQSCSAVTLEFENVEADWLRIAERHTATRPTAEFLEICQDRMREKSSLRAAGFPVTPFAEVRCPDDLVAAGNQFGWPIIAKTCRSGYDGKGQIVVRSVGDAVAAWQALNTEHAIAEQRIDFAAEVSMLGARNARGDVVTYPLIENSHANHILDISRCPVSPQWLPLEPEAREIVAGIASRFRVEGLFCVEFFIDASRGLMINEIAPRPHNSGHLTIEAFATSQFEQQLRATCNLPLAATDRYRPAAMANLLGDLWLSNEPSGADAVAHPSLRPTAADAEMPAVRSLAWEKLFLTGDAHLHLYGKSLPRRGRKMGHLTCTAASAEEAVERVRQLRAAL